MVETAERYTSTYAYATHMYSGAIIDVPVFSWTSSISSTEPPSTTKTIGFLTRDPIGFEGSKWGLYEMLNGSGLVGIDPTGNKCCLRTWNTGMDTSGSHSALKCSTGYFSMYPGGPHTEAQDNKIKENYKEVCMDCLNEAAIAAKWAQIKGNYCCGLNQNCATFVVWLLEAGSIPKENGSASFIPCPCPLVTAFRNKCKSKMDGVDTPYNAVDYLNCLSESKCDPWERLCFDPPNYWGPSF